MDTPNVPQPDQQLPPDPLAASTWPAPSEAPAPNSVFFGRFGMRAGWSLLIFLVCFLIVGWLGGLFAMVTSGNLKPIMDARVYHEAHPQEPTPKVHIQFTPMVPLVQDGITFFALLGICWFFSKAERRPLRSYGLGTYRWSDIFSGALFGIVIMGALIFVLHALRLLVFDYRALHGAQMFTYGLAWLAAFLFVGFAEEYSFRGYMQYTLMRGYWGLAEKISATNTRAVAFWLAALTVSLLFGAVHLSNNGENAFGILQVVLAGITFSYALWRTGSLWWAVGIHATWDWSQSFLYGVADSGNVSVGRLFVTHPAGKSWLSGGSAGPEGSIFASIALILTMVAIHFLPQGEQPALEQEPKPIPEAGFHNVVA